MKIPVCDEVLRALLAWARDRGFSDDTDVAFTPAAWGTLGNHLWNATRRGNVSDSSLISTSAIINRNITGRTPQNSEARDEEGSALQSGNIQGGMGVASSVTSPGYCRVRRAPVRSALHPESRSYILP